MPVSTPFGSACMLPSVDRKVGAEHPAEVATATFLSRGYVWRMVSLGIKGRRERENFGRAKFDTEPAPFASFDRNRNEALCHKWPPMSFSSICGDNCTGRAKKGLSGYKDLKATKPISYHDHYPLM